MTELVELVRRRGSGQGQGTLVLAEPLGELSPGVLTVLEGDVVDVGVNGGGVE